MAFKKSGKQTAKPDKRGIVAIRIFLQDPNRGDLYPVYGNRREDILLEDTTVGEVREAIEKALWGGEGD